MEAHFLKFGNEAVNKQLFQVFERKEKTLKSLLGNIFKMFSTFKTEHENKDRI